jgi:hypothetical protein
MLGECDVITEMVANISCEGTYRVDSGRVVSDDLVSECGHHVTTQVEEGGISAHL